MKQYQDHDPVRDKGKAEPHPKRPTHYTYRGGSFGNPLTLLRDDVKTYREHRKKKQASGANLKHITVAGIFASIRRLFTRAIRESKQP